MSKQTQAISNDLGQLAEDTRALVATTAEDAKEQVGHARDRVVATVENGKAMCGRARDRVAEGAHYADATVRKHPYPAIGIAFAMGTLIGDLIAHRWHRNGKATRDGADLE
jgi:ElaB/YqjD/DUF883 family membrane-anchored ribosome-binding protein